MRACLLALLMCACEQPPEPAERPQARPLVADQPSDRKGLVQVPGEWEMPFEDPASLDELREAIPGFEELRPAEQNLLYRVLNVVPAACAPCEDKPLARCAIAVPAGCEHVPRLVARARRLAVAQAPAQQVRDAVSYPDHWTSLPNDRAALLDPDGTVRVEVWVDPSSPFTGPTLDAISKMPQSGVALVLRYRVSPEDAGARTVALAAIAAGEQGMGLEFLRATEAWRQGAREARREGLDPFGNGGLEGIATLLAKDGLDVARWERDRASGALGVRLDQDLALGRTIGVRAVPTWFIDGFRLRGGQSDLALGRLIGLALEDAASAPGG